MLQHPDITAIERDGWPGWHSKDNQDTPEARENYIECNAGKVVSWLRLNYPEMLDEFMDLYQGDYQDWLN